MKNTILVTGGSGLIGTGIQKYIEKNKNEDNFIFLSSTDWVIGIGKTNCSSSSRTLILCILSLNY